MKNKKIYYFGVSILFILLVFLLLGEYNLTGFINAVFYISLAYLIVVLFLYTVRGGFYDGVTFSFRRFRAIMSRDYLEEWKEKPLPSEKNNDNFYSLMKYQLFFLLLLFSILLVIYYII